MSRAGDDAERSDEEERRMSVMNGREVARESRDAQVFEFGTAPGSAVVKIPVQGGPIGGIAISRDGSLLVVTNNGTDTVSVVGTDTCRVTQTVTSVNEPFAIAMGNAEANRAYVSTVSSAYDAIAVIDVATNTVLGTHPLALSVSDLTLSPDDKYLYVSRNGTRGADVAVLDTTTGALIDVVDVSQAPGTTTQCVRMSPDGSVLYVGANGPSGGLLCDQLTSASVVLPSGQAVTASATDHPDLFWALRGGGGGNFGVTTSLTFATFPSGDLDVVNLNFPPQSFAQVLVGWQNWLRTADRGSWALADATVDPLGTHCRILATCPAGSGGSVAAAIVSAVGTQPTGTENHTFNYLDLVRYLAVGNLNPSPLGYVGGSDVFTTITPATAQGIASAVDAFPRGAGRMLAIMHALDGALATVSPGATAFPWRRQSALVQWYVETSGSPSEATSWLNTAHQAVRAYSVGGYVNYLEVNQPPARYFGPNLSRLSAVRQKYDPSRVHVLRAELLAAPHEY